MYHGLERYKAGLDFQAERGKRNPAYALHKIINPSPKFEDLKMIEFTIEVDATGLQCPLPLLRLKKSLSKMQIEEVVRIIATDPAAHLDIGVYVEQSGHEIIEYLKEETRQIFYIRKKDQC